MCILTIWDSLNLWSICKKLTVTALNLEIEAMKTFISWPYCVEGWGNWTSQEQMGTKRTSHYWFIRFLFCTKWKFMQCKNFVQYEIMYSFVKFHAIWKFISTGLNVFIIIIDNRYTTTTIVLWGIDWITSKDSNIITASF